MADQDTTPTNLREIMENLVMPYTDFLTEKGFKEVGKDIDEAIAAILALLPEKQEKFSTLAWLEGEDSIIGWNKAIDQTRRKLIGEQPGDSNTHSEIAS